MVLYGFLNTHWILCVSHKHGYETEIFSEKKTFNLLQQRSVYVLCAHALSHIAHMWGPQLRPITSFKNMELCSIDQERWNPFCERENLHTQREKMSASQPSSCLHKKGIFHDMCSIMSTFISLTAQVACSIFLKGPPVSFPPPWWHCHKRNSINTDELLK